jgi:hypothetical protein
MSMKNASDFPMRCFQDRDRDQDQDPDQDRDRHFILIVFNMGTSGSSTYCLLRTPKDSMVGIRTNHWRAPKFCASLNLESLNAPVSYTT